MLVSTNTLTKFNINSIEVHKEERKYTKTKEEKIQFSIHVNDSQHIYELTIKQMRDLNAVITEALAD